MYEQTLGIMTYPGINKTLSLFLPPLADEIRRGGRLLGWDAVGFFPEGDALHQKGHVPCQRPHNLKSLGVLAGFPRQLAMDAVPVLAGSDWHP